MSMNVKGAGRPDELGADLVAFSPHELCGPRGVAALCIRKAAPLATITTGGAQEEAAGDS
jgi:cysteine sulfinate desulfinase/cysteine desulfurase-like protein